MTGPMLNLISTCRAAGGWFQICGSTRDAHMRYTAHLTSTRNSVLGHSDIDVDEAIVDALVKWNEWLKGLAKAAAQTTGAKQ